MYHIGLLKEKWRHEKKHWPKHDVLSSVQTSKLQSPVKCMFSQKRLLISQVLPSSTSSERSTLDCLRAALPLDRRTASMIGSDTRTTLLSSKLPLAGTLLVLIYLILVILCNQQRHPNTRKLCFATSDNAQQPVLLL